jgi:Zn-dependent protease
MFKDREINLGKVFDIEIAIDYSWFWIFLIITYTFTIQLLPALMPMEPIWRYLIYGIFSSILFFGSVLAHELAHSLVARNQGDPINKITLFLFGGVANLEEEPRSAKNEIVMAFVGPLTSILIGIALVLLSVLLDYLGFRQIFVSSIGLIGYLNFTLAIFNLLPGFPLDGGRIFRGIIWHFSGDLIKATRVAVVGGKIIASLLIGFGIYQIATTGSFGGLWLILIGLFLFQAAGASMQRALLKDSLSQKTIDDIILDKPIVIDDQLDISQAYLKLRRFRRDYLMVETEGEITGLIGWKELRGVSLSEDKTAGDIARSKSNYARLRRDDSAEKLITKLVKSSDKVILVEEGGTIVDYISLNDLRLYLELNNFE